jgi:carbohydrate-selective porin OprB
MVLQQSSKISKSMFMAVLLNLLLSVIQVCAAEQEQKTTHDFFEDFLSTFRPRIKYSPADEPAVETEALPHWLQSWKDVKKQMEDRYGTSISILLDDHHQQIIDGPSHRRGRNIFWWNLTVKQNLWEDGKLIFKARGSNTDGKPPNGITPLVGPKLNLDWAAYETELGYIANLYLEQRLMDDKLLVALGKLTFPSYFDENKVAGWDFFSHSLARNQAFIHKYHTIGALGRYDFSDKLYMQVGVTDIQGIRSETGLNTAFHGEDYFLTMSEIGFKTINNKGLEGNYRFDVWYDPQPLTRHDGKGFERDTVGLGVSFDQAVTEKSGAFFRYGWDDGRVRKFSNYWSFGGTRRGLIPEREKDVLGFGFGQGITHQDYRRANNATHTETIVEAYYKIHMTDWYSITLDIQTLFNPGTNSHNETAVIPGIRLKMLF